MRPSSSSFPMASTPKPASPCFPCSDLAVRSIVILHVHTPTVPNLPDIVIPGIYVALMLRYDVFARIKRRPYFALTMLSYVAGLGCTIGVMLAFNAAQPALLYLVPAILLASLGVAAARGEITTLLAWSEVRCICNTVACCFLLQFVVCSCSLFYLVK